MDFFLGNFSQSLTYFTDSSHSSELYVTAKFNVVVPAGHSYQVIPSPPDSSDDFTIYILARTNTEYPENRVTREVIHTLVRNNLDISSSSPEDIKTEISNEVTISSTVTVQVINVDKSNGDSKSGTIDQTGTIEID
jgi:hypothetical protein